MSTGPEDVRAAAGASSSVSTMQEAMVASADELAGRFGGEMFVQIPLVPLASGPLSAWSCFSKRHEGYIGFLVHLRPGQFNLRVL